MDLRKYLIVFLVIVLASSAIVNHKVVRNVNFDSPNTFYSTQIEVLNDSPDGGAEIKSYQVALNASIHNNLIHL
jgi:hypothetical protein